MSQLTVTPLPFRPEFEVIPDDEAETAQGLIDALHSILETTYEDYGHPVRSVHAKAHGFLHGELEVMGGLPEALAQGVFAQPGRYPVVMRVSTNPGDLLDDRVSTPRGLAIKVIGVQGPRLPGSEAHTTQDWVMQNAPAFTAADPKAFLKTLKLLAKTTDRAPGLKRALSAALRGTEAAVEALGGESGTLKSLGGHPLTHPLGETYYSVVPLLHGSYYGKLSVAPVSAALVALTGAKVDLADNPDGLREAIRQTVLEHGGEWEVRVQLATDLDKMPIEDASVVWPEDESPYVTVARITAPPQDSYNAEGERQVDQDMAFSPWHGLAAHRPLGGVMRVRKPAYEHSAEFRRSHSGCPIHEPRGPVAF
ncbi:catalase family protein [Pseudomonas sp. KNUC1026]|uniref:catalase family protein n=1 Tax=Pseudomonas sp. KNUC1026 TaxID=2893890 RepID=UPI001F443A09|nr:catalase family protein [Pseudomonas sp. KNUC1026]UFH50981.1 catalase family protein [Pseudomonas sp. KNUC1026]